MRSPGSSSGFGAAPVSGSWTTRSTSQRSDSGNRSKLRSRARSPGRRTARSMSRKPPAPLPLPVSHSRSNCSEVKPGSTPQNAEHLAHRVRARSPARSSLATIRIRSRSKALQVGLELHRVAAAGDVGGVRIGERLLQRPRLIAAADVVEVVGEDAIDRVADHVDQPRVADQLCHPLGDAGEAGQVCVVRRALAADRGGAVEVARVPLGPQLPVQLGDEVVELLRARHRDLGVQVEVVVKARRPALQPADHDQVRQRPLPLGAPASALELAPLGGEALVRSRDHRLVGGVGGYRRGRLGVASGPTGLSRRHRASSPRRGSCAPPRRASFARRASRRGG